MWDATLDLYRRALKTHPNIGICLQAYLHRTKDDLAKLSAASARDSIGPRGIQRTA